MGKTPLSLLLKGRFLQMCLSATIRELEKVSSLKLSPI